MQEDPQVEPALDGTTLVETIFGALLDAAIEWWYVWLLFVAVAIGLRLLSDWSKRVEARAKAERRAKERAERQWRRR